MIKQKHDVVSNNAIIKASDKQFVTTHHSKIKIWETKTSLFAIEERSFEPVKGNALGYFKDGIIFKGKLVLIEGGSIKDSYIHIIDIKEKPQSIKKIHVYGHIATINLKPKDSECVILAFP